MMIITIVMQVGSRQLFVFNTHLQASHSDGNGHIYRSVRELQLRQLRDFISDVTRHSSVPWILAGDFNVDAIADHTYTDAFGYLCDSLPQESEEYRCHTTGILPLCAMNSVVRCVVFWCEM